MSNRLSVKKFLKTSALALAIFFASGLLALLIFEFIYRSQLIDTFRAELQAYNSPQVLSAAGRKTLLTMGDSFSAGNTSYPAWLRVFQDDYRVINASVPGTGALEAAAAAPRRFEEFKPSVFIYQVYVGNDLYNISYPVNWSTVSFLRNVYWSVAQRLRSVWFINYKNGQLAYLLQQSDGTIELQNDWDAVNQLPVPLEPEPEPGFSPERYALRDRIMIQADPWIIDDQINVKGGRSGDYRIFLDKLTELLALCQAPRCRAYVLIIPHAAQVDPSYLRAWQALGAQFDQPQTLDTDTYPFINGVQNLLRKQGMAHVKLLNPIALLRESERQGKPVYYRNDSHLNLYGQQLIAQFIIQEIGI